jgi:hypothetical protein
MLTEALETATQRREEKSDILQELDEAKAKKERPTDGTNMDSKLEKQGQQQQENQQRKSLTTHIHDGFLAKKGEGFTGQWAKRKFNLVLVADKTGTRIPWMIYSHNGLEKGRFALNEATVRVLSSSPGSNVFRFNVTNSPSKPGRAFELRASSNNERQTWVAMLRKHALGLPSETAAITNDEVKTRTNPASSDLALDSNGTNAGHNQDSNSSKKTSGFRWVPDSERTRCVGCAKQFTFFLRKHHCRVCGDIFCKDCTHLTKLWGRGGSKGVVLALACKSCNAAETSRSRSQSENHRENLLNGFTSNDTKTPNRRVTLPVATPSYPSHRRRCTAPNTISSGGVVSITGAGNSREPQNQQPQQKYDTAWLSVGSVDTQVGASRAGTGGMYSSGDLDEPY